jgi:hypothetical protein
MIYPAFDGSSLKSFHACLTAMSNNATYVNHGRQGFHGFT